MSRVTVDADLVAKLKNSLELVELCDEAGNVIGRFHPVYDKAFYDQLKPQISEEELKRREQSKKWFTTEEVRKHLENL
jgi:hypothetical protein